jgi:hypothetical protein
MLLNLRRPSWPLRARSRPDRLPLLCLQIRADGDSVGSSICDTRLPQALRLHTAYTNARTITCTKRSSQTPRIVHVGQIDRKYLESLDASLR